MAYNRHEPLNAHWALWVVLYCLAALVIGANYQANMPGFAVALVCGVLGGLMHARIQRALTPSHSFQELLIIGVVALLVSLLAILVTQGFGPEIFMQ